ncbi:YesL family protein [Sporosarcina ureilytica]|uniref:DUF624 domain-containing protein n=1 Tax=Sporosarcina ureilytica TaxID=298596 RepID=A0A1D8JIW1_9BACL|nr:DUF624 domain-containing protein [Sporosarcina ureilytica]AOV08648.1 hypothetical protein BI350_14625 [Sporosarcina ureilytica]
MTNPGGLMGGLYALCEWFMRFAVVNLLWLLFNFPIVYLGFNMLVLGKVEAIFIFLIPMIVLIPFVFFPATTAMFGMAREWVFKDREGGSLIKAYWQYYKENYKRSIVNGLVFTAIWLVWAVDVYFFYENNVYLFIFFLTMGIVLFVFTINSFSITVHYEMTVRESLKNAFFITVGSPVLFLAIAISSGMIIYMSFNVLLFLLPFFTGSLIAFLSFAAFYSRYLKITQAGINSES